MTERRPPAVPARPASVRRRVALARLVPSTRILLFVAAALALVVGGFFVARRSSLFAVRSIEVQGAPPTVAAQVRAALAGWRGTSLVGLDGAEVVRRLDALPAVASVSFDRAFPHTLRVTVSAERPAAVLRRGTEAWLVSTRARVLGRVARRSDLRLPRIWIPTAVPVSVGQTLGPRGGGAAARAVAPLAHDGFPVRVATAVLAHGELVLGLVSHVQVRLGQPTDVLLKLAIARRIIRAVPPGTAYLDVSVPERPVAGPARTPPTNPQVSG